MRKLGAGDHTITKVAAVGRGHWPGLRAASEGVAAADFGAHKFSRLEGGKCSQLMSHSGNERRPLRNYLEFQNRPSPTPSPRLPKSRLILSTALPWLELLQLWLGRVSQLFASVVFLHKSNPCTKALVASGDLQIGRHLPPRAPDSRGDTT